MIGYVTANEAGASSVALLTRREVAERLRVHTETVKRWQHQGKLPAIVINARVTRYDPAEVARLLAGAKLG